MFKLIAKVFFLMNWWKDANMTLFFFFFLKKAFASEILFNLSLGDK
jgi:hypothetical protein